MCTGSVSISWFIQVVLSLGHCYQRQIKKEKSRWKQACKQLRNWYSMWINQLMVPVHENQPIDGGSSWESTKWWWKFVRINQLMAAIPEYHPIDGDSSFESTNWWWRFIQGLLGNNEKKLAWSFNFTFRYIDDVFSINNSRFGDFVDRIYPIDLEIKDTTDTDMYLWCKYYFPGTTTQ